MSAGARPVREKPHEGGVWSPQSTAAVAAPPSAAEPEAGLISSWAICATAPPATRSPIPFACWRSTSVGQLDGPLAGRRSMS